MGMIVAEYGDLGGGMNNGIHSERMNSREAPIIINFYPYGTHLRRRGGHRKIVDLTSLAIGTAGGCRGMIVLSPTPAEIPDLIGQFYDRQFDLMIMGENSFARRTGSTAVPVPVVYGRALTLGTASFPQSHLPVTLVQYKGVAYAMRKDVFGSFFRIERDRVMRAGMNTDFSGLLTSTPSGGGTFPAGDYTAVVVFRNTTTGLISGVAESDTFTAALNDQVSFGLPIAENPQADAVDLYLTLPGLTPADGYYFLGTAGNTGATIIALDPPTVLSARLEEGFVTPSRYILGTPQDLFTGDIWHERLWATDGVDVFFSEFFQPEQFKLENSISVYPDDGYSITGIKAWGDRLIVAKTNAIYYITGDDLTNFTVSVLSEKVGSINSGCLKVVGNQLYWMGPDKAIYRSNGSGDPERISDPWMTPMLERIQDPELSYAGIRTDKNWYVIGDPNLMGTEVNSERVSFPYSHAVFNYRENTWTSFTFNGLLNCFAVNYDESEQLELITGDDSFVYNFADDTAGWDDIAVDPAFVYGRQPVSAGILFKSDDFGVPGRMKSIKQVGMLFEYVRYDNPTGVPDDIDMRVYANLNFAAGPLVSRTLTMDDGGRGWRQYGLGLLKSKNTRYQFFVLFTTIDPLFSLREVRFDVGVSRRLANRSL